MRRVEPAYPAEAKTRKVVGTVTVRILVAETGEVQRVCGTGPELLRPAAERAAFDWMFNTPTLNGKKVPYVADQLIFKFTLDGDKALSRAR